jgi:hypothetical protein
MDHPDVVKDQLEDLRRKVRDVSVVKHPCLVFKLVKRMVRWASLAV